MVRSPRRYLGMPQVIRPDGLYRSQQRFGLYRWHVMDPIRFQQDLKVTIQALGWRSDLEGKKRYLPLQDDIAATALWYQTEPHAPFPADGHPQRSRGAVARVCRKLRIAGQTCGLANRAGKGMTMTARAMWKAEVCLDSLRVPVKLYAAVEDTTTHFRLLHKTDLTPVKQQMVDTASKSVVEHEDIQRAVQVERGVFVVVTEEEREEIQPPPSRDIVIRQVVKRTLVDDRWFDRPYFLGPDGDTDSYFALAEALDDGQELAVAQWVMRSEYYAGALYADQGYLMISTFRNADEMARIDRIRPDPARAPEKRELDLADQLIAALEDTFDPYAFRDEYHERVQDFLRKKAAGKKVSFPKAPRAADKDRSLLETLEASVKQGKRNARGAA